MAVAFKDAYIGMDEQYEGQTYKMSANTLLTWPSDIDASRLYMNTSETRQSLTILNPDVPRLSTGWENVLGRLNKNRSFKQLEGTWEVIDIVRKFQKGKIYTLVLYNEDTNTWDMIETQIAENLTEKFGYLYNFDAMDKLKVGDKVTDEILYKSTAYDDNMNYRYGKNAKVYYTTSTDTLEDAVKIRKGWADGVRSVEVDTVPASVNNNHVPLNIYGDKHNYKVCPDFGEPIKDSCVFATRPYNAERVLTDFQNDALRKINPTTDIDFVISEANESYIYDIDIFYNGSEPFPDTVFFHQLKGYYEECCEYADRMMEWAINIKESGDKYTQNIPFFKSKYQHWNDPDWKFCGKEKNRPFGYMVVQFHVKSILGLVPGSKLAGRYGDKGVISKVAGDEEVANMLTDGTMDSILDMLNRPINDEEREKLASQIEIVPDEEMPYTDEFPVDILLNASGAIRRLNPGQIDEVDINFQGEEIRKKVCSLKTMEEKENLIFEFMGMLNEDECSFFYEMYKSFDKRFVIDDTHTIVVSDQAEKERFIKNVEEHGFYIRKEHDSPIRYETIKKIYERFDFIKPLPLYIDIFGTKHRRIIKDGIVADKYMLILKHNSNKNFSARSTFRVNRANLPVKDTTKRDNRSQYSKSPVRIGEAYNLMSSISGRLLAEWNIFMRSSTLGKKSLQRIIETDDNPLEIKRMKVHDNYINANADIFASKLKAIGLGIEYVREGEYDNAVIEDVVMPLQIGKYTIYDSPLRKQMYNKIFAKFIGMMESVTVVESYPGEKEDYVWEQVFKMPEIVDLKVPEDIQNMLHDVTKNKGVALEEATTSTDVTESDNE
jgi:hypothetical protein